MGNYTTVTWNSLRDPWRGDPIRLNRVALLDIGTKRTKATRLATPNI
jgi:hypothetical protein